MGFTIKTIIGGSGVANTASATVVTPAVSSGDLIVAWAAWNGVGLSPSISDGTSTFEMGSQNTGTGSITGSQGGFFYLRSSVATGTPTYTITVTGGSSIGLIVEVWTPSAAVTFDLDIATANSTGSTSVDSGSLATTGSDELIFGAVYTQNDSTPMTAQAIGGTSATTNAAEVYFLGTFTVGVWYLEKTGTNNATVTLNSSQPWFANAISFKIDGGASQILHPASWM